MIDDSFELDDSKIMDSERNSVELFFNLKMRNMLASKKVRSKLLLEGMLIQVTTIKSSTKEKRK